MEAIWDQESWPAPLFALLPHTHREGAQICGPVPPRHFPRAPQENAFVGLTLGHQLDPVGTIVGILQRSPECTGSTGNKSKVSDPGHQWDWQAPMWEFPGAAQLHGGHRGMCVNDV